MHYFNTVIPTLTSQKDPPFSIFYETKSNLNEQHVKALAAAGVRWIQPGIESLHDDVLRLIDKGNSAIANVALLKFALENGVRVSWNLLFGVPNEQDQWYDEMASWLPMIVHLQPPASMVRIRYDRFSPYHQEPARFGIRLSPNKAYSFVYPLSADEIGNLAYFFEDYHDTSRGRFQEPGVRRVIDFVLEWHRLFFPTSRGSSVPVLSILENRGASLVIDTRLCAERVVTVLQGLADSVYRACRAPCSKEALFDRLKVDTKSKISSTELDDAVAFLLDSKLLLQLNGRFLALATREHNPPLPKMRGFPGGHYDAVDWERPVASEAARTATAEDAGEP
jgi:ribosomal peptide maturation radical SAM protein 1